MPTGYTAAIADDISFNDFVLQCARAMGACIMQRDDNGSDPPKLEKVDDYHERQLKIAEKRLEALLKVDRLEYALEAQARQQEAITRDLKNIAEKTELREKYERMLAQVSSWVPPTNDHENFKKFMMDQINESIKWDCDTEYSEKRLKQSESDIEKLYQDDLEHARHNVEYYKKGLKEEIERVNSRNQWKIDLYNSLGIQLPSG